MTETSFTSKWLRNDEPRTVVALPAAMHSTFHRVYPILPVPDLDVAIRFYRDILGFAVAWQWDDPPSRAGVVRGAVEIQLLSDPRLRAAAPSQIYIEVEGIDEFYAEVRGRDVEMTRPLGDRPWGMKDFQLRDPAGNQLGFAEPLPNASAES